MTEPHKVIIQENQQVVRIGATAIARCTVLFCDETGGGTRMSMGEYEVFIARKLYAAEKHGLCK
jgi:hypothetical protein